MTAEGYGSYDGLVFGCTTVVRYLTRCNDTMFKLYGIIPVFQKCGDKLKALLNNFKLVFV